MLYCTLARPIDEKKRPFGAPVVHVDTEFVERYPHACGVMKLDRCLACGMELREFTWINS